MARPKGQFQTNKERLYAKLVGLTNPKCWASNRFLAEALGVSVRQVQRYLEQLVKEKRIACETKHYVLNGWKTKRIITLVKRIVARFGKPKHPVTSVIEGRVYEEYPMEETGRREWLRKLVEKYRKEDAEEEERMKDPAYRQRKNELIQKRLAFTSRLADDPQFAEKYRLHVQMQQKTAFGE